MNRREEFSGILEEIRAGRKAELRLETEGKMYLRRFVPNERLILLGGGHIAVPLCKIAAMLGFSVTVADDRPLFASWERFPEASSVLCDSFSNAIGTLRIGPSDYVCVITRGHRWDGECLRRILKGEYPFYLGMIGSRRRVRALLDLLEEEGYEKEKLSAIHTPIGLKIGAETPGEIAVSICAELIQCRRGTAADKEEDILKRTDTDEELLRFLAENEQPAALMTVISASGSTPAETGAMMAVDKAGRTKGTIGGGCGEAEALTAARGMLGSGGTRIIEVKMTNDVAAEEGMACGGTMTVRIEDMSIS